MASPAMGAFNPAMFNQNGMFLGLPNGGRKPAPIPARGTMAGPGGPGDGSAGPTPAPGRPAPAPPSAPQVSAPVATGVQNFPGAAAPNTPSYSPTKGPFTPQMWSMGNSANNTSGWQGQFTNEADLARNNENQLVSKSSGITDFLSGSPTDSPLYKSLLSASKESIGNSYDSAIANTRAAAASRGFGYESPNEQGAEAGMRASEAGALAGAPSQALQGTIAPEMQAADLMTRQAGLYGGEATSMDEMISELAKARMGKSSSMTASMAGILDAMISGSATAAAGAGK